MKYLSDEISIFDSLSHPTFSGVWEGKSRFRSSSFEDLIIEMLANNICGSIASTYPLNEEIQIPNFQRRCDSLFEEHNLKVIPAWVIDDRKGNALTFIQKIDKYSTNLKYPLILKFNANYINYKDFERIKTLLKLANLYFKNKLIIYICTYPFFSLNNKKEIYDPISIIDKISKLNIECPIIILHGCVNRLLDAAIYAQHFKNIYIDLSFTICRYVNSTLINDLIYLFEFLDQKTIIGSDHPEYNYLDLRKSIKFLEEILINKLDEKIIQKKFENIFSKNILSLINI